MPERFGIDRTIILPEPLILELGGFKIEERLLKLETALRNFERYLTEQQFALDAAYDELARRTNELAVEAQWVSDTPAQITADQNNYDLGNAIVHRISTDASRTITGFKAPVIERMDVIVNVGSFDLVIAHQNVGSDAGNRVITSSGVSVTLTPDDTVLIWYDLTSLRWRQLT